MNEFPFEKPHILLIGINGAILNVILLFFDEKHGEWFLDGNLHLFEAADAIHAKGGVEVALH